MERVGRLPAPGDRVAVSPGALTNPNLRSLACKTQRFEARTEFMHPRKRPPHVREAGPSRTDVIFSLTDVTPKGAGRVANLVAGGVSHAGQKNPDGSPLRVRPAFPRAKGAKKRRQVTDPARALNPFAQAIVSGARRSSFLGSKISSSAFSLTDVTPKGAGPGGESHSRRRFSRAGRGTQPACSVQTAGAWFPASGGTKGSKIEALFAPLGPPIARFKPLSVGRKRALFRLEDARVCIWGFRDNRRIGKARSFVTLVALGRAVAPLVRFAYDAKTDIEKGRDWNPPRPRSLMTSTGSSKRRFLDRQDLRAVIEMLAGPAPQIVLADRLILRKGPRARAR